MLLLTLIFAALSGLSGVALGAAGAHALKATLDQQALDWLETGIRYQMYHAVALLALAALIAFRPVPALGIASVAWFGGTVLFSGALYGLAFTGVRTFAHIAPFGGLTLIAGWAALLWAVFQIVRD